MNLRHSRKRHPRLCRNRDIGNYRRVNPAGSTPPGQPRRVNPAGSTPPGQPRRVNPAGSTPPAPLDTVFRPDITFISGSSVGENSTASTDKGRTEDLPFTSLTPTGAICCAGPLTPAGRIPRQGTPTLRPRGAIRPPSRSEREIDSIVEFRATTL